MKITGLEAIDGGNDVLRVRAVVENVPGVFEAVGWVSATVNHYDAPLDEAGHRPSSAQPRAMTKAEVAAYCEQLLVEQNPELVARPNSVVLSNNAGAIANELKRHAPTADR